MRDHLSCIDELAGFVNRKIDSANSLREEMKMHRVWFFNLVLNNLLCQGDNKLNQQDGCTS